MTSEARPAGAVVVLSGPSREPPQMLFLRRPESMRFLGGFHAFPGGALHDDDLAQSALSSSTLTEQDAARALGEASGDLPALAFYICALRELFEEVGLLYSEPPLPPGELGEVRRRLRSGESLDVVLSEFGARLATDRLVFMDRWVAPSVLPVRFDVRVFAVELEGVVDPDPTEVAAVEWHTAGSILALAEGGMAQLAPPTVATVNRIGVLRTIDELRTGEPKRGVPKEEQLAPGVARIIAPNPGLMTGPGTNTYLLGEGELVVIDPGSMDPSHLEALVAAGTIRMILLTHGHADHFSGVLDLAEMTGAEVAASDEFWRKAVLKGDGRVLADGEIIESAGLSIQVVATPGHASDHICFWLPSQRALFCGDLVMGESTPLISPPDGNLVDYLASLSKVAAMGALRLYPGHFDPIDDVTDRLAWYIVHRMERERQIVDAISSGASDIAQVVLEVYADTDAALHALAERSVMAHLEKLVAESRVKVDPESGKVTLI